MPPCVGSRAALTCPYACFMNADDWKASGLALASSKTLSYASSAFTVLHLKSAEMSTSGAFWAMHTLALWNPRAHRAHGAQGALVHAASCSTTVPRPLASQLGAPPRARSRHHCSLPTATGWCSRHVAACGVAALCTAACHTLNHIIITSLQPGAFLQIGRTDSASTRNEKAEQHAHSTYLC